MGLALLLKALHGLPIITVVSDGGAGARCRAGPGGVVVATTHILGTVTENGVGSAADDVIRTVGGGDGSLRSTVELEGGACSDI